MKIDSLNSKARLPFVNLDPLKYLRAPFGEIERKTQIDGLNSLITKLTTLSQNGPFVCTKTKLNGLSMAYHVHMYEQQSSATEIYDKRFFSATR